MTVTHALADEIERKRQKIISNPDYYLKRARRVKRNLHQVGSLYSFWLEHPEMRGDLLQGNPGYVNPKIRKVALQGVSRIEDAWKYLSSVGQSHNFLTVLDPGVLMETGRIIEPEKNTGAYRTEMVRLKLDNYIPPNPDKVPDMIDEMLRNLRSSDYVPIEAAAAAHLHIAGIQPFRDGNKRTARLVQDRILGDYELPPAHIQAGERHIYLDLLEQGLVGVHSKKYELQRPFFDYIGGKVNNALDDILHDLHM